MTSSPMLTLNDEVPSEITRLRAPAIFAAVCGIVLMLVGFLFSREQFFRGYLVAWLFILGVSMGSMAIVMIGYLTGGEWALILRRPAEAAAINLTVVAVLFIPILFGLPELFPWARPALVKTDPILIHKAIYLNPKWFALRFAIYFIVWLFLAMRLRRISVRLEARDDPRAEAAGHRVSALGLVLFVFTMTAAAVDWILSRDAHWFSTIIGFATVVGQALSGMSFCIWIAMRIAQREPLSRVITRKHLNDLGNLMFTLVILWAYMSFAQLLIIWMGNSREDVSWYVERGLGPYSNGWQWLGLFLITFHFFVPFFILLSRQKKRRTEFLGKMALWLLLMRFIDIIWLIVPTDGKRFTVMVLPAVLALGGIWLAMFVTFVSGRSILPANLPIEPPDHHHGHGHGHTPEQGSQDVTNHGHGTAQTGLA